MTDNNTTTLKMTTTPQTKKIKQKKVTIVHCWSAPRSRSTALLYSFEARGCTPTTTNTTGGSTVALDEPLYTTWLRAQGDAVSRPYLTNLLEGRAPPVPNDTKSTNDTNTTNDDTTKHHKQNQNQNEERNEQERMQWEREQLTFDQRLAHAIARLPPDGGTIFCKQMAKFCTVYDFSHEYSGDTGTADDDVDAGGTAGNTATAPAVSSSSSATNTMVKEELQVVHKHVLLIRDPVAVLASWGAAGDVHGNNPTIQEVGIVPLLSIYSTLQSRRTAVAAAAAANEDAAAKEEDEPVGVVVLDSDDLAADPVGSLQALCAELEIVYTDSMMSWPSGPHECDGPWAAWWYADVHKSSGWTKGKSTTDTDGETPIASTSTTSPITKRYRTVNPSYMAALRASYPAYEYLKSLTRGYKTRGPSACQIYEDPRNEHILVYIGAPGRGQIVPREMAGVSPFDSSVQGGDAAWEGLRVYRGKILSLDKHLKRLFRSAKALGFVNVHSTQQVTEAIFEVLAANGMRDSAHLRLTLSRGEKCTSSMNPTFNVYGTTLIILPEWKPTEGATTYDNSAGISLISASQRRNPPQTVDSKIHHNNLINNILPKIQANLAGCADAIMLDVEGYVSETNATNIFMVDDEGTLLTPHADHCLPGITRATVLQLASELGIPVDIRRISLAEFHAAEEVFTTGTMGELTPVVNIDGRIIGSGIRGPVTAKLQELYNTLPEREGWATDLPPFDD